MSHTTFISYKYSESTELRDKIITKLGKDASYYKGERSFSDDLSSLKAQTIKEYLKGMIAPASVMIVIVSPNMARSKWMEWEIQYSLRKQMRDGRYSNPSGIICVIAKDQNWYNPYGWFYNRIMYDRFLLFDVLNENVKNLKYTYKYTGLANDYIDFVREVDFLKTPHLYIENAFEKAQNIDKYDITIY